MGFLKRLFSIKSIRGKKKQKEEQKQKQELQKQEQCRHLTLNSNEQLQIINDQEHEAAVTRLLRSSSARFAVVSELDYASLPPLSHPINNVIQTPAASTISLSSSSISRGNYTVHVHKRKRHASTEFPFANRDLDSVRTPQRTRGATAPPQELAHYLGLHTDPSVASLLELYDDHGQLPEKAFSNSPPSPALQKNQGRAQTRRSGSTLRQLLGAPSSREKSDSSADLTEGDISWAERCLGESDSVSSPASLSLPTPRTPQTHFVDNLSRRPHVPNDDTPDYDSMSTVDNPALNSLEVELSMGSTSSVNLDSVLEDSSLYINYGRKLPHRASQVFTFLTKKRLSNSEGNKSLPRAPAVSRSSSVSGSILTRSTNEDNTSQISRESSTHSATPRSAHNDIQISQPFVLSHRKSSTLSTPLVSSRIPSSRPDRPRPKILHTGSDRFTYYNDIENQAVDQSVCQDAARINEVKVLMTGPTKVIVTAPTPSQGQDTPSRIPRGPRGPPKKRSSSSIKNRQLFTERPNSRPNSNLTRDISTGIPRPSKQGRRSSDASAAESDISSITPKAKSKNDSVSSKSSIGSSQDKENRSALSVKTDLPSTPIRSPPAAFDSHSLFRAIVTPSGYRPRSAEQSSPASSSELSPVGRQLMMDVRQQRMKARELERERNKRRSERRGNAYVV